MLACHLSQIFLTSTFLFISMEGLGSPSHEDYVPQSTLCEKHGHGMCITNRAEEEKDLLSKSRNSGFSVVLATVNIDFILCAHMLGEA